MRILLVSDVHLDAPFSWAKPEVARRRRQALRNALSRSIKLAVDERVRGEMCPIILDDVLVQCDRERKRALLDVLLTLSQTRQVILLTQEEEVLQWAREFVSAPNELVTLPGIA